LHNRAILLDPIFADHSMSQTSKPSRGRPRALDEAKRRDICALVSAGCRFDAAAEFVGCAACTVRREADRDPQFHALLRQAAVDAQRVPNKIVRDFANNYVRFANKLKQQPTHQNGQQPACRLLKPVQLSQLVKMVIEVADGAMIDTRPGNTNEWSRFS
jgi:hypothetical protein